MDGSASSQLADMRASNRLVKQTYSVFVNTSQGRRKWHLSMSCSAFFSSLAHSILFGGRTAAYYVPSSLAQLRTVDDLPQLAGVLPPEGMYTSAKVGKSRALPGSSNSDIHIGSVGMPSQLHPHPPTYAPFPNGPPGAHHNLGGPSSPLAHRRPTWPVPGVLSHAPPSRDGGSLGSSARTLPGLPALGLAAAPPVPSPYSPRHPLDDEALRSLNRSI